MHLILTHLCLFPDSIYGLGAALSHPFLNHRPTNGDTHLAALTQVFCYRARVVASCNLYGRLPYAKRSCVLVDRKAAVLYPALLQMESADPHLILLADY
jgi:hypothetical protein